jgi:hypothetical protein
MLPSPLHPAVIHFPIVFAVLLPLLVVGALWSIHRGAPPHRAWRLPLAFAGALTLSAAAAVWTGQREEKRVENRIGERAVESHEEAAERFLMLSGALLVVAAAGLTRGTTGRTARVAVAVGSLALLAAGYQVGHSGGRIVYGDGAAAPVAGLTTGAGPGEASDHDD